MKRTTALVLAAVLAAALWSAGGAQEQPAKVSDFMKLKLNHAQKSLEAITIEDYAAMAKHAQALSLLSREATWRVLQTEEYVQHSTEFRRTADALGAAAKKKNVDAAALAYVDLTMKCVNCHKYVRGVRMARR
jgi:hypothetical protein